MKVGYIGVMVIRIFALLQTYTTFIPKVEQVTESPNSQTVLPIAKANKITILDQKKLALLFTLPQLL